MHFTQIRSKFSKLQSFLWWIVRLSDTFCICLPVDSQMLFKNEHSPLKLVHTPSSECSNNVEAAQRDEYEVDWQVDSPLMMSSILWNWNEHNEAAAPAVTPADVGNCVRSSSIMSDTVCRTPHCPQLQLELHMEVQHHFHACSLPAHMTLCSLRVVVRLASSYDCLISPFNSDHAVLSASGSRSQTFACIKWCQ